ncbi:M56 family metallopeptidase [Paenibacillus radicis (ex Xue et al. 2023)]|uniref:M56 family metallopeptidase n=1 Tax=Paenibacillus radicis (ex Xue et al. 2023) TaxID=2972489 RepID=A0ABT1YFK7_9BACL|nr:M56 family metallopeptidase [Paenibacillus radicis (ex Xue et al. 2023)]MCR8631973.1 M56 family metallopeptidase [Paenibacillus radicis (ex Xue et al. 2023)]
MTYVQMYLQVFFDWVIRASLMASVLVVLIVMIKWMLRNKLLPKWHYLLWLPVVIRLVLPWAPESSFSVYNLLPIKQQLSNESLLGSLDDISNRYERRNQLKNNVDSPSEWTLKGPSDVTVQSAANVPEKHVHAKQSFVDLLSKITLRDILLFGWLLGVIVLSLVTLIANINVYRRIKKQPNVNNPAVLQVFEQCKRQMSIKQPILLTVTDAVPSPAVYGFMKPRILLSRSLIRSMDADQFRYIFNHELAHIKRRDVAMNWLMHVLVILHWFNPIMWIVNARMRADQEVACDALALSHIHAEQKVAYGQTIINLLEHYAGARRYPGLVGLSGNYKHLKRRILMIKHFKKNSFGLSVLGIATVLTVCSFSLVNAQGAPTGSVAITDQTMNAQLKEKVEVAKLPKPGGGQIQSLTVNTAEEAALVLEKYFNLTGFPLMQDEREVPTASYVTTNDSMRVWVGNNKKIIGLDNMKAWKELKNRNETQKEQWISIDQSKEKAIQLAQPFLDVSVQEVQITTTAHPYNDSLIVFDIIPSSEGNLTSDGRFHVTLDRSTGAIMNINPFL